MLLRENRRSTFNRSLSLLSFCFAGLISLRAEAFPTTAPIGMSTSTFNLSVLANASKARTKTTADDYQSDAKLTPGASLGYEFSTLGGETLTSELGLSYFKRSSSYENYYEDNQSWVSVSAIQRASFSVLSIGAGLYVANAIGDTERTKTDTTAPNLPERKSLDYGWIASGRVTLGSFFVEGRYLSSLTDLSKTPGTKYNFNDAQALVGVKF